MREIIKKHYNKIFSVIIILSFLFVTQSVLAPSPPTLTFEQTYQYDYETQRVGIKEVINTTCQDNATFFSCTKDNYTSILVNKRIIFDKSYIKINNVRGEFNDSIIYVDLLFNYSAQSYNCTSPSRELGSSYVTCDSGTTNIVSISRDGDGDSYCEGGETCLKIQKLGGSSNLLKIDICNNAGSYSSCNGITKKTVVTPNVTQQILIGQGTVLDKIVLEEI